MKNLLLYLLLSLTIFKITYAMENNNLVKFGDNYFHKFNTPGGGLCGYFVAGIKPQNYGLINNQLPYSDEIASLLKDNGITSVIFEKHNNQTIYTINKDNEIYSSKGFISIKADIYMVLEGEHFSFLIPTETSYNDPGFQKGILLEKLVNDIEDSQWRNPNNIQKLYETYFDDVIKINSNNNLKMSSNNNSISSSTARKLSSKSKENEIVNYLIEILDIVLADESSQGSFFHPSIILNQYNMVEDCFKQLFISNIEYNNINYYSLLEKAQQKRESRFSNRSSDSNINLNTYNNNKLSSKSKENEIVDALMYILDNILANESKKGVYFAETTIINSFPNVEYQFKNLFLPGDFNKINFYRYLEQAQNKRQNRFKNL